MKRMAAIGARKTWLWRQRDRFVETESAEPRLFVDVSAIVQHDAKTGIQRVVRAVWAELSRRGGDGLLVQPIFATRSHGYCCAPSNFFNEVPCSSIAEPVKIGPRDKFLGLDLSAHLLPYYRPQLNAWKAHGATLHFVVYDLLPLQRPDWFSSTAVSHFRRWFDVLSEDADQAICISEQVAVDLRQRMTGSAGRGPAIARMKLGADIAASVPSTGLSREASDVLARIRNRPAILMVGTVEPRKGHDVVLAAFERLWQRPTADAPDLVLVGKPGWKTADIQTRLRQHVENGARLHWLPAASDEALCRLYDACSGVLVASRAEGFGLPLIEAAMFRRPVLARDLPVFREQHLANVSFFKDDSPEALAPKLMDLAKPGHSLAAVASLPTWSQTVDSLLREMGYPHRHHHEADTPLRKAS